MPTYPRPLDPAGKRSPMANASVRVGKKAPNATVSDGDPCGRHAVWSIVLVLATDFDRAGRAWGALAGELGASLLNFEGKTAVCLRSQGTVDVALAAAVTGLTNAAASAGVTVDIVETRMVFGEDVVAKQRHGSPVSYYTVPQCAAALGVSPQRARQLLKEEQLPTPDGYAGASPLWEANAFERFVGERRQLLSAMPLGLNWRHAAAAPSLRGRTRTHARLPTRIDDTAVLPGGRKATLDEVLALRDQLISSRQAKGS